MKKETTIELIKLNADKYNLEKDKRVYQIDQKIFKDRTDANLHLELEKHLKNGLIQSFDDSALYYNDLEEYIFTVLITKKKRKSKYNAKKVIIDNLIFDSKLEAKYYIHLLEEKKNNNIRNFDLKPKFELQPKFKKNGKTNQAIVYVADYAITDNNGDIRIIDTKGVITPDFKLKQKLFDYKYPELTLELVLFKPTYGGWIELEDYKKARKNKNKELRKK